MGMYLKIQPNRASVCSVNWLFSLFVSIAVRLIKPLVKIAIYAVFFYSVLFVAMAVYMSLTSSVGAILYSSLLPSAGFVIAVSLVYYLEGVQQAANTAKSIDDDVVMLEVGDQKEAEKIILLKREYEKFSSARQVLSIISILFLKESLAEIIPETYKVAWLCDSNLGGFGCVDFSKILIDDRLQFIAAAGFTAWVLQLYPKRIARLDPISYLTGARLYFAGLVRHLGQADFDGPTLLLHRMSKRLFRSIPSEEARYSISSMGILDELGKRLGYYAESMEVRIQIGEMTRLRESVVYKISDNPRNREVELNSITHRTNLTGQWIFEDSDVRNNKNIRTTTEVSTRNINDYRTEPVRSSGQSESDDDEVDDVVEEMTDEERIAFFKEMTGRSFTRIKSTSTFNRSVSHASHPDLSIELATDVILIGSLSPRDNRDDRIAKVGFQFLVSVPVKSLRVVVTSTKESIVPTGLELRVHDVFEQSDEPTIKFKPLDKSLLHNEEFAGSYIELNVPYLGSEIEIKTVT